MTVLEVPMSDFRSPNSANAFFERGLKAPAKVKCWIMNATYGGSFISAKLDTFGISEQKAKCKSRPCRAGKYGEVLRDYSVCLWRIS